MRENDKLVDKNRQLVDDVKRLEKQIGRMLNKPEPMDAVEKREEGELWREKRMIELEKELQAREEREQELNDQLFR